MQFSDEERVLLNKYNIFMIDHKHYYKIDLNNNIIDLEYSSPLYFKLGLKIFHMRNWQKLVLSVISYIINKMDIKLSFLEDFNCDWTKRKIFMSVQPTSGIWKKVNDYEIFFNINFTSNLLFKILTELLDYLNISKSSIELMVNVANSAEPSDAYSLFYNKYKRLFIDFLVHVKGLNDEKQNSIIGWIEYIDGFLHKISPSKKSLLMIEDITEFYNIKSKMITMVTVKNEYKQRSMIYIIDLVMQFRKHLDETFI